MTSALLALLCQATTQAQDGNLDPAVLKKLKQATVRLRVTLPDNSVVQGSGFFGAGPNLILTNAHVLGMLRWESRKPKKVEVVVNGGEPNEKTYLAQTIGIDAGTDLGVLYLPGKDLPDPLPLGKSDDVLETQPVYIIGFPYGEALGKNVTVARSSISSVRKGDSGFVAKIQVDGGMHPGNSGGPVTDAKGSVIGVAVSGIKGTQIHFAIPARQVSGFLGGRTHRWVYGIPYKDGDGTKIPMTTFSVDPLRSVKGIRVEFWVADPGPNRPLDAKSREPAPGDSPRVKQDLVYKDGVAVGDVPLPTVPPGKSLWIQIFTIKTNGSESWIPARAFRAAPAVDRVPVELAYKPLPGGPGRLALTTDAELKLRDRDGADHSVLIKSETNAVYALSAKPDEKGTTTGRLFFPNAKQTISIDGKELPRMAALQQQLKQLEQAPAAVTISKDGDLADVRPILTAVPPKDRNDIAGLIIEMVQGIDATVVPVPGGELTPGQTWKASRTILITVLGAPQPALADLTYRYLGTRTQNGKLEAVVKFDGAVRGRKGEGANIAGKMEADAALDVATGQVVFGKARIDVDLDLTGEGASDKASGVYSVLLRLAPTVTKAPKQ